MIQRVLLALAVVAYTAAGAVPAFAQTIQFVPRYDFHLNAQHLSGDQRLYQWDADFGGEIDVVDYDLGRFTFWANYNVVMGNEIRIFDPNQGNYILAGSSSVRVRGLELAGVFYHQSRHLGDRPKQPAVAWNMMGVRLIHAGEAGRAEWRVSTDVRGVVQHAFVDYRWEVDTNARAQFALRPRIALVASGGVRVLGVSESSDRGTQTGFLSDAGVRFEGEAGAVELFLGAERRIDPYPVEFGTATWFRAGFRLLSR